LAQPFYTEVYCKDCKRGIMVVGTLDAGLRLTTGGQNVLALNIEEKGRVLTTEGNKTDIRFEAVCPECNAKESYEVLI
jgi:hypothetical protein